MSYNNENKPAPTPALGPTVMRAIGRELRTMYAYIIAEGVPEHFAEILRRLDQPSDEGSTPPTAPSASQDVNRDDENGTDAHESLGGSQCRALASLAGNRARLLQRRARQPLAIGCGYFLGLPHPANRPLRDHPIPDALRKPHRHASAADLGHASRGWHTRERKCTTA
jgi:Anti-sigma factor NepR